MSALARIWTPQQEDVFTWFAEGTGNLVVEALAGTGKTTTIMEAVTRSKASKILVAAFNKSIAEELTSRISPELQTKIIAKTLNGLGAGILFRKLGKNSQLDTKGGIETDRCSAARDLWQAAKADNSDASTWIISPTGLNAIKRLVSFCKSAAPVAKTHKEFIPLAEGLQCFQDETPEGAIEIACLITAKVFEITLKDAQTAYSRNQPFKHGYDDQVWIPVRMGWALPMFDDVVIDEAQDMSKCQIMLAMKVARPSGRIAIVGDKNQAIYGFRGADSGAIGRMTEYLKAKVLKLTCTYRCGHAIVKEAQKYVPEFTAAPGNPEGATPATPYKKILELAQAGNFILSYTNAPLMKICLALIQRGIRARIKGRDIGERLLTIIRRLEKKNKGYFRETEDLLDALEDWADRENVRIGKTTKNEQARESARDAVADILSTFEALIEVQATVEDVKDEIRRLFSDDTDPSTCVMCSTIHKSKGLEASQVFFLTESFRVKGAEHSNLTYVAVTRARDTLHMVVGGK